jgi:hypothetical protein
MATEVAIVIEMDNAGGVRAINQVDGELVDLGETGDAVGGAEGAPLRAIVHEGEFVMRREAVRQVGPDLLARLAARRAAGGRRLW